MNIKEKVKRYILLIIGLILNSFGVALVTKGGLGSSPLACFPYALSLVLPQLSMGTWCAIFDIALIVVQFIVLKGKMEKRDIILQVVLSFGFGIFCDLGLWVFAWVNPTNYVYKWICLVLGTLFFGFGINFELTGSISMLPGNALPKVIARRLNKEYGPVRVCCDVTFTCLSAAVSIIFLKALVSVREGTIVAALLVGNMAKLVKKILSPFWNALEKWVRK